MQRSESDGSDATTSSIKKDSTADSSADATGKKSKQQREEVIDLTADDGNGTLPITQKSRKNGRYKLRHGKNREKEETINIISSKNEISPNNASESGEKRNPDSREDLQKDTSESECSRFSNTGNEDCQSQSDLNSDGDTEQKPAAENRPSAYELLRLERIKRNIARLVSVLLILVF